MQGSLSIRGQGGGRGGANYRVQIGWSLTRGGFRRGVQGVPPPEAKGGLRRYLFSLSFFVRYSAIIASRCCFGTSAYLANSIENSPLPWVAERRSVE